MITLHEALPTIVALLWRRPDLRAYTLADVLDQAARWSA